MDGASPTPEVTIPVREVGSRWKGGWLRALGLMVCTAAFSVVNPGLLVALPFSFLAFFLRPRGIVPMGVAVFTLALVLAGEPESGIWYLERGWAFVLGGWFLALTLRWPGGSFLPRGLGAVAGSFAAMGALFWARPGEWAVVDWAITSRMEAGLSMALEAVRITLGADSISSAFEARVHDAMAVQGLIFPALLGLGSLAGLGLAWWIHQRMARNTSMAIGPLRDFRFNDQLVWILIGGLLVLLGTSGLTARMGTNAVVFMGALYALRGVAVVLFMSGGVSLFGGILLLLAFVFVAPLLIVGAFVVGLGDTWLDLRTRQRDLPSG